MVEFALSEAMEILGATPSALRAMTGNLSEAWVGPSPDSAVWGPLEILGHLVVGEETDWIPRMRIMLDEGVSRPFTPFDREAHFARPQRTARELLDRFSELRIENLSTLESFELDDARLDARGMHPGFGEVRLGDMLAAWAVHDLSHLAQAAEAMAKRYAEAVGPWRRYLPVLDREELPSE